MFSGFFNGLDGCGTLRMMVCINPREADFDESLNVMEFAETTKKIQIERVDPRARFLNTPGMIYRKQLIRNTNLEVIRIVALKNLRDNVMLKFVDYLLVMSF